MAHFWEEGRPYNGKIITRCKCCKKFLGRRPVEEDKDKKRKR